MGNGNKNTQMSVLLKEKTNLIWLYYYESKDYIRYGRGVRRSYNGSQRVSQ